MEEEVIDKRSVLGLASFSGLILALALSVPFTLDRAQKNQPLTLAVTGQNK